MSLTQLLLATDSNGRSAPIIPPPGLSMVVVLAAGQGKTVTVPNNASRVLFNATVPFWARIGDAAAVPQTDILDGTAPELSPIARTVMGGQTIGLAAAASCIVNLTFYRT